MKPYLKLGEWNAVCDVCGFNYKSSQLRKRWDGFMVCDKDFELRNPQDFIRIPAEDSNLPWARPVPDYTFVNTPILANHSAVAGYAMAGVAVTGTTYP
jgi:hypothetical protein